MATPRTKFTWTRVVPDTKLVLSALATTGDAKPVLRRGTQSQRLTTFSSKATTNELTRVLVYLEIVSTAEEQEDLLSDYLPFCDTVTVPDSPRHEPICCNPYRAPFLNLAIASATGKFVTGAQDLLNLFFDHACIVLKDDTFLPQLEPV